MTEYKSLGLECVKCGHKKLCEQCDIREEREKIIIDVVNNFVSTHGYSPSIDYIAKEIGINKSNAHFALSRMAVKGYITYGGGKKGIIRVL